MNIEEKKAYKEEKLYKAIKEFINKNGYAPSIRELMEITNMPSTASVYFILLHLKENGFIDFIPKKYRTIKILK